MGLKLPEGEEGHQGGVSGWGCGVTPLKGRADQGSAQLVELIAKAMETSFVAEAKRVRKIKSPQWEAEKAKNETHKELSVCSCKNYLLLLVNYYSKELGEGVRWKSVAPADFLCFPSQRCRVSWKTPLWWLWVSPWCHFGRCDVEGSNPASAFFSTGRWESFPEGFVCLRGHWVRAPREFLS